MITIALATATKGENPLLSKISAIRDRISAEAEPLAFGPRYANGHALRSRSVGFAETRDSRSVTACQ
ncbi:MULTISPECIES: hypothetical protein [unclassified Moorena]|uniref:hypothetical protein n=1 Tax=unclassified Moorena TaxID=2683338 RepID=UPI0013FF96FF|nr:MULTISPECIES: hypothetical protein [unclassified Moorena]NEO14804.1 hypothetical protein [Moorena sp. SIO3E8]NEP97699.1 hypothetical protein [Moorena sp. SIO3F7]